MRCSGVVEWMHQYLDNELQVQEEKEMLEHIAGCPQCEQTFRAIQALNHELEALPLVVPRFSLVDAIMPQLDALDRVRQVQIDYEEVQPAQMIPVANINQHKKKFFTMKATRTFMGVAAAIGVLGVAIYSYSPEQISDAQIQYHGTAPASLDSTTAVESNSNKMQAATSPSNADEDANLDSLNNVLRSSALDNGDSNPEVPDIIQPNSDHEESTTPIKDNKEPSADSSSPSNPQQLDSTNTLDPKNKTKITDRSVDQSNGVSTAQLIEEPVKQDVEITNPDDSVAKKSDQDGTIDPVPNKQHIMDDIARFSASQPMLEKTGAVTNALESPNGTMNAVLENNKLVIYQLPNKNAGTKKVLQSVDIVGDWIMGVWSLDSTTFTYHIERDGQTSVYTFPEQIQSLTNP
ncbi:anti-sigma factor family protein [Paenibacillus sp. CMAA1364]